MTCDNIDPKGLPEETCIRLELLGVSKEEVEEALAKIRRGDAAEGAGEPVLRHHANETLEEQEYLLAKAAPPKPAPDAVRAALDDRQRVVIEWGERCFGADHMRDKIVRAARFFEEAAELVQAVGLPRDHAMRAFDHVYSREAGDPAQEAGGVANTLIALCGALNLSFDACQQVEITRCLAKDPSHFAGRNEAKLREVDASPAPVPPADGASEDALTKLLDETWPDGHRAAARKILSRFSLSPPGTGAAEPVAWRVTAGDYKSIWFDGKPPKYHGPYELAYATPPVRGDQ